MKDQNIGRLARSRSPQDRLRCNSNLNIQYRRIDTLQPDPANPRRHSRKQLEQIAESIKVFDFIVPVLIDRDGKIVCGHGRTQAAAALGMREVPTICLEHLSPAQIRAFMIADNKLTENASWDDRLLAEQLRDLSLLGLDFSLEVTGFEIGEIDLRIASLEELPAPGDDPADVLPEVSVGPSVSQLGDLWLLGPHRLLCGSALNRGAFAALMDAERAGAIFTDPPYNVPIDGHASGLGAVHHRPFPMASGEMNKPEFTTFLARALCNLVAFSTVGSLHYICIDWRHLEELLAAGREAYGELKNLCVWAKDNAGMGSLYRSQHELIFVFKQRGAAHRNKYPARSVWSQSRQCLALPRGQLLRPLRRGGQPLSMAPDSETDSAGRRRDSRLHRTRRDRARCLRRQWHDVDRGRAHRSARLRARARSGLCRHQRSSLAGVDRREGSPCHQWQQI